MIAPASPADWLQGLTMTTLLAASGSRSPDARLEEPTLEVGDDLDAPRGQSWSAPSTRRSCVEGTK